MNRKKCFVLGLALILILTFPLVVVAAWENQAPEFQKAVEEGNWSSINYSVYSSLLYQ